MRSLRLGVCLLLLGAFVANSQSAIAQRKTHVEAVNPALSSVESVRYLDAFVKALAAVHRRQQTLAALKDDDFVGRMTQLRMMAGDASTSGRSLEPFTHSQNDRIANSAVTAVEVYAHYKGLFEKNVGLYEDMVRVFGVPHELTPGETKTIAEFQIQASKVAALFAQASELLRDAAMLAFTSVIVAAPGDPGHIALDLSAPQKAAFVAQLRQDFGELRKKETLSGTELAAFPIMVKLDEAWRLAR